jgi:hypothetical protein
MSFLFGEKEMVVGMAEVLEDGQRRLDDDLQAILARNPQLVKG